MHRTGIIIQARTSSTRFPQKVLKELPYASGISVLGQVIRRSKLSRRVSEVIVATTRDKDDDRIVRIAKKEGVRYFRGDKEDVLSRYYHTACEAKLGRIVRITSDCPCIDPHIIDEVVEKNIETGMDYTSNALKGTFPNGLDVEVVLFSVLEEAYKVAKKDFEREHVMPYIYKSCPDRFKINSVEAKGKLKRPEIRITLDTEEDYAFLCAIYDNLYSSKKMFYSGDIINLVDTKPWLLLINRKVLQKKTCNSIEEELKEAIRLLDLQELKRTAEFLRGRCNEGLYSNRRWK